MKVGGGVSLRKNTPAFAVLFALACAWGCGAFLFGVDLPPGSRHAGRAGACPPPPSRLCFNIPSVSSPVMDLTFSVLLGAGWWTLWPVNAVQELPCLLSPSFSLSRMADSGKFLLFVLLFGLFYSSLNRSWRTSTSLSSPFASLPSHSSLQLVA